MTTPEARITKTSTISELQELIHPCTCEACTVGCKHGSGALIPSDLPKLAAFLNLSEEEVKKRYLETVTKCNTTRYRPKILRKDGKPYGRCIFFDDKKGCTVHDAKPFECTLAMGCKDYGEDLILWFMLNEFVNKNDPESIRQYNSYLKAGGKTIPGGKIEELLPDKEKRDAMLKNTFENKNNTGKQ